MSLRKRSINDVLIQKYKKMQDCVHGQITISNFMTMVIDSKEFQRLRKLKQLGSCSYVYHSAEHTRFQHSIGTAYLAGELLNTIHQNHIPADVSEYLKNIPELRSYYKTRYDGLSYVLDEYIIELVKIAALCHDIGHGPFSHIFDDHFLPYVKSKREPNDSHEMRSGLLVEKIIKNNVKLSQFISDDCIQFIKNIINPQKEHNGWLYQIVSNNLNGLDVDKYDYIARDSHFTGIKIGFDLNNLIYNVRVVDNNICYQEQVFLDICELFRTRYRLHRTVYAHKAAISSQFMIIEIFNNINDIIGLADSVNDMDKFCEMTDEYILTCHNSYMSGCNFLSDSQRESLEKVKLIIDKLNRHELYPHVGTYICDSRVDMSQYNFKTITDEKLIVFQTVVGFVSGKKSNPLENIYVYNASTIKNKKYKCQKVAPHDYSRLLSAQYQENLMMIFSRDRNIKNLTKTRNEFSELFPKIPIYCVSEKMNNINFVDSNDSDEEKADIN